MSTMKKKGLDRDLEALLSSPAEIIEAARQEGAPTVLKSEQMQPGKYQPRTHMDEGALQELTVSIRVQGLMQPTLVYKVESDGVKPKYEIITGERRFRASRLAGLTEMPVLVKDVPDESAAAMALIENTQREDPNPLEEVWDIARLVRELQLTHEQAAESVRRSRSVVPNLPCLLNLAQPVQTMLMVGGLDMGHARTLLAIDGVIRITLTNQIANKRLSVREAEKLVASTLRPFELRSLKQRGGHQGGRDVARLKGELADQLGLGMQVKLVAKGRGQLTVQFSGLDELDGPLARLCLDAGEEAA